MLGPIECPFCGTLGKAHGYQQGTLLREHIKR